jgi:hypothetical protein
LPSRNTKKAPAVPSPPLKPGSGFVPAASPPPGASRLEALRRTYVLQRTLVFVTGLPPGLKDSTLKGKQYFGQYGTIVKFNMPPAGDACYVLYERVKEAVAAIFAVDGFVLNGSALRANFGTNKYCQDWLEKGPAGCRDRPTGGFSGCSFFHAIAPEADIVYRAPDPRAKTNKTSPNVVHPSASGALGGRPGAAAAGPNAAAAARAAAEANVVLPPPSYPPGMAEVVSSVAIAIMAQEAAAGAAGAPAAARAPVSAPVVAGGGGGARSTLASFEAPFRSAPSAILVPPRKAAADVGDSPLLRGLASAGGGGDSPGWGLLGAGLADDLALDGPHPAVGRASDPWLVGGGDGVDGVLLKAPEPFPAEFVALLRSIESLKRSTAALRGGALTAALAALDGKLLDSVFSRLEGQRRYFLSE